MASGHVIDSVPISAHTTLLPHSLPPSLPLSLSPRVFRGVHSLFATQQSCDCMLLALGSRVACGWYPINALMQLLTPTPNPKRAFHIPLYCTYMVYPLQTCVALKKIKHIFLYCFCLVARLTLKKWFQWEKPGHLLIDGPDSRA